MTFRSYQPAPTDWVCVLVCRTPIDRNLRLLLLGRFLTREDAQTLLQHPLLKTVLTPNQRQNLGVYDGSITNTYPTTNAIVSSLL